MRHLAAGLAIAALALLGMFVFPGHTWLQSDTQIYVPMIERLSNPALYSNELIASRPHIAWTLYDEFARAGRALTRQPLETVLLIGQILFRALAILGIYLIGRRFHESPVVAMFGAGVVALGATIVGPSVLTFEYEPVPRGFAVSLLLCAIGLAVHGETVWASAAASGALLFHAPTTLPFWLLQGVLILRTRRWAALTPPAAAAAVLALFAALQPGITESQHFFSTIPPDIEQLQRFRASYNWISLWPAGTIPHYALLWVVAMAALFRLRGRLDFAEKIFFTGLPAIGLLSIPLSWLLLDQLKWSLMPQMQPARSVMLVTLCAVMLCIIAAAESTRRLETFAWLIVPFLIPVHRTVTGAYTLPQVALIVGLAAAGVAVLALRGVLQMPAAAVALTAAAFLIPAYSGFVNYPEIRSNSLDELSAWARTSTPVDAVFVFPQPGKDLRPGVFRAQSLRAVYVDWKAGGQVNYFDELGREWWRRWQRVNRGEIPPEAGYVVYKAGQAPAGATPVYSNAGYVVIKARA